MGWLIFIEVLGVLVISFGGAKLLVKKLRMPTYYYRFAWMFFALLFGIAVLFNSWQQGWKDVKRGIDLKGGTILVYQVMHGESSSGSTQETDQTQGGAFDMARDMDELAAALRKRVDPDGTKDVTIRQMGKDQVEIVIPEVDPDQINMLKNKIANLGTLEFRITANENDHQKEIALAKELGPNEHRVVESYKKTVDGKEVEVEEIVGWWIPVGKPFIKKEDMEKSIEDGKEYPDDLNGYVWRPAKLKEAQKETAWPYEVLVVNDNQNVTGSYLVNAMPQLGGFEGPAVSFEFNAVGAKLFGILTRDNQPARNAAGQEYHRMLGIILNGELQSAPRLNSPITAHGQITGNFTQTEVKELSSILKAGRLPAVLSEKPSSEITTGATLGVDTIQSAKYAMLISVLFIMCIMLYYYRFSGIVAVISLLLLILLTFGIMVSINAAFTLPGLAGLVLTIGMAVDANILIYERMREESEEGNSVAQCVRNGFGKAFSAILDSNITTALVGLILFIIGTEQIRGFALILLIGIAISMFSAIYVGRAIFELSIKMGWFKEIKMRRIFPKTHINFMKYAPKTLLISCVVMVICIGLVFARVSGWGNASSMLDIDFLGGNRIQVLFNDEQTEQGIFETLQEEMPGLTVTDVTLNTDAEEGMLFRRYDITSPLPKEAMVGDNAEELDKAANKDLDRIKGVLADKFPRNADGTGGLKSKKVEFSVKSNVVADTVAPLPAELPAETPADLTAPVETAAPAEAPAPVEEPAAPAEAPAPVEEVAAPAEAPAPVEQPAAPAEAPAPVEQPAAPAEAPAPVAEPAAPAEAPAPVAEPVAPAEAPAPVEEPVAPAETTEPQAMLVRPMEQMLVLNLLSQAGTEAGAPAEALPKELPSKRMCSVTMNFTEGGGVTLEYMTDLMDQAIKADSDLSAMESVYDFALPNGEEIDNISRYPNWIIHVDMAPERAQTFFAEMETKIENTPDFPASTTIGSKVADSMCVDGLSALFVSLLGIIFYIWFRFQKVSFGLSSTFGLIHNVVIALGLVAASTWCAYGMGWLLIDDFKINLTMLAAFLTLIGYSLNDTIVVFDRIREIRGKHPQLTKKMINKSLNQTLARTVMTSLTTFIVSVALYIWGGQSIHSFSFVMTIGIIIGTYASIFVATPLLYKLVSKGVKDYDEEEAD